MSRHTFLTSSSVFGDSTKTVEILSVSDVKKLVDKKCKVLAGVVGRLEQDNRKLRAENLRLKKRCDEIFEILSAWSEDRKSLAESQLEIAKLKEMIDGLTDNCAKIFASVIKKVLTPKLELFSHQIGVVMPNMGKTDVASDKLQLKSVTKRKRK